LTVGSVARVDVGHVLISVMQQRLYNNIIGF